MPQWLRSCAWAEQVFWTAVTRILLLTTASAAAHGADIGGWMEHNSRAEAARDDCVELIALATEAPRQADHAATLYYASGLCYLHSGKITRDPVAAAAWLTRAAELDHPLARRALIGLREPAAASVQAHPRGLHCHDLGLGRRLCHGGPVLQ